MMTVLAHYKFLSRSWFTSRYACYGSWNYRSHLELTRTASGLALTGFLSWFRFRPSTFAWLKLLNLIPEYETPSANFNRFQTAPLNELVDGLRRTSSNLGCFFLCNQLTKVNSHLYHRTACVLERRFVIMPMPGRNNRNRAELRQQCRSSHGAEVASKS